jgi:hypothetical protein
VPGRAGRKKCIKNYFHGWSLHKPIVHTITAYIILPRRQEGTKTNPARDGMLIEINIRSKGVP